MGTLNILHLSDGRPGHYHLAEGIIAALARLAPVSIDKREIKRRMLVPARLLRLMTNWNTDPGFVLSLGYGLKAANLAGADLIVSAGGETVTANAAAAAALGAANIFCGSLRGLAPEHFSLVVTSYQRRASLPRHFVTLKPSALDPASLGREAPPQVDGAHPPRFAGLLMGGDSGLFKYNDEEWFRLLVFARDVSAQWGTRWLLSTSRRTAPHIAEAAFDLAKDKAVVADFVDYRLAGPGTLPKIFARADAILCTEDSSTMISEAVWARLPVVGVAPRQHAFKPEEADYRKLLAGSNWCRFLPIEELSVERFGEVLGEITPLIENPQKRLARDLKARLPELFGD